MEPAGFAGHRPRGVLRRARDAGVLHQRSLWAHASPLRLDHARRMTASWLEKSSPNYALVQRHGQDLIPGGARPPRARFPPPPMPLVARAYGSAATEPERPPPVPGASLPTH